MWFVGCVGPMRVGHGAQEGVCPTLTRDRTYFDGGACGTLWREERAGGKSRSREENQGKSGERTGRIGGGKRNVSPKCPTTMWFVGVVGPMSVGHEAQEGVCPTLTRDRTYSEGGAYGTLWRGDVGGLLRVGRRSVSPKCPTTMCFVNFVGPMSVGHGAQEGVCPTPTRDRTYSEGGACGTLWRRDVGGLLWDTLAGSGGWESERGLGERAEAGRASEEERMSEGEWLRERRLGSERRVCGGRMRERGKKL